jgi:hypothetical protein
VENLSSKFKRLITFILVNPSFVCVYIGACVMFSQLCSVLRMKFAITGLWFWTVFIPIKKCKPESFYFKDWHIIDSKNTIILKPAFKVLFYSWHEKVHRYLRWKGTKYVFWNFTCLYSEHAQLSRTCDILTQHGYALMSMRVLYLSTVIHLNLVT